MSFKIGKKSLAKITIFLLLIILLLIINIPNITESLPEGSKLKLEDPKVINSFWSRKITVYSDEDKHYYNIPVSISIPENLVNVMLYRYLSSDLKMDVTDKPEYNFQVVDSDSNGLTDIVKWVVPELSEVSFSVEGVITEGKALGMKITQGEVVTFDRNVDCHKCGQHKTPPLTDVNMTITATVSNPVTNGVLIDYYPVDWLVTDANNGDVSSFNSSYKKIEWNVGDVVNSIDKWYVIRSPSLTSPPTKYYLFSEFAGKQSDVWMVIVSDPLPPVTIQYNQSQTVNITGVNTSTADNLNTINGLTYNLTESNITYVNVTLFHDSFVQWNTTNCANALTSGWSQCRSGVNRVSANSTAAVAVMTNNSDAKVLEFNDVDAGELGDVIKCLDTSSYSKLYTKVSLGASQLDAGEYIRVSANKTGAGAFVDVLSLQGTGGTVSFSYQEADVTNYISTYTCFNISSVENLATDRAFADDFSIIGSLPAYRAEVEHNATGVTWNGTLNYINVSVNFTTNVTSTFNLTIYNFNSGSWDYSICQNGTATQNTWYNWWCNVTTNPSQYNSSNGVIRVRLNGTVAHTGVALVREDYVQYYVNYTPTDLTPPTWSNPSVNVSNPHRGDPINISVVWSDSGGLAYAWLETNETGSWKNYTGGTYGSPRNLGGTASPITANFTWTNQTGSPRVIGWIIYANDTANNINGTNNPGNVIRNFTMWGWSNITWTSPSSGSSYSVGSTVPLTCFINDTNTTGSGPITGYDAYFYNKTSSSESYIGKNYTNSSGYAVYYWNTTGLSAGTYYPKCNITSNSTLFYNASEYNQANTTVSLQNIVEITISQALSNGIMFGDITPNTKGNPARNNTSGPSSGTEYNLTVGSSSTNNIDFYVKLNATFETGIYINETSSTTSASSSFSTNTTVDASWSILGDATSNCTNVVIGNNCWFRLYFDVGIVSSGYKERNFTICGVVTGSNSNTCG